MSLEANNESNNNMRPINNIWPSRVTEFAGACLLATSAIVWAVSSHNSLPPASYQVFHVMIALASMTLFIYELNAIIRSDHQDYHTDLVAFAILVTAMGTTIMVAVLTFV